MKNIFINSIFCMLIMQANAQTQAYDVDRTYGTNCGITPLTTVGGVGVVSPNDYIEATFIYPDGSAVTVYTVDEYGGFGLSKLDVNGYPDISFGTNGTAYYESIAEPGTIHCGVTINDVDTGANGKIFVTGTISSSNSGNICGGLLPGTNLAEGGTSITCFNSDGSLNYVTIEGNPSVSPNSPLSFYRAEYFAVAVQPDGKAVCFGAKTFSGISGQGLNRYIARRYNTDGTYDSTYNPGLSYGTDNPPIGIFYHQKAHGVIQADGKAVFCYRADTTFAASGVTDLFLTRLNLDGSLDTTFGTGSYTPAGFAEPCISNSDVIAFRKINGDKMRISGTLSGCGTTGNIIGKVLQVNSNGLVDTSFGTGGFTHLQYATNQTWINDIAVDPVTDKTYAVGTGFGGIIFRLNSNGSLDSTFNGYGYMGTFNSSFAQNFQRAALYSTNRLLISWQNYAPGMTHSVFDLKSIPITATCKPFILSADSTSCFTYQWYKNDTLISGANSSSYAATGDGDYFVKGFIVPVTNPPGLTADSMQSTVITIISIDNSVTQTGNTLSANGTGTYQWVNCNNNFSHVAGETNQTFNSAVGGSFALIISNTTCSDTSACFTITTGITSPYSFNDFSISPNPSSGVFNFKSNGKNISSLSVYDLSGRLIQQVDMKNKTEVQIDVSGFQNSVFILKAENENSTPFFKLMKQ